MHIHRATFLAFVLAPLAVGACDRIRGEGATEEPDASDSAISRVTQGPTEPSRPARFEGEIDLDYRGAPGTAWQSYSYLIKGTQLRYDETEPDAKGPRSGAIFDMQTNTVLAFNARKSQYMKLVTGNSTPEVTERSGAQLAKTSATSTVEGRQCEHWRLTTKDEDVIEACVLAGVPFLILAVDAHPGSVEPAWAAALTANQAFPLQLVRRNAKGVETARIDVKKIVTLTVSDTSFQVPPDFVRVAPSPGAKLPGVT